MRQYSVTIAVICVIYGLAVNEQFGKLCAGVAILLFGMLFLSDGFKAFSGGFLEKTLTNSTKTPLRSILFGTIVTSLMQSSSLASLALPLIVGGLLFNFQKSVIYKGAGKILAGLGFFFLGVFYIKMGFEDFKDVMDLSQYKLEGYKAIVGFIFIGALVTSIIQSSHATLAIIISAYVESQIGYTEALAATLGTSVGGVVTALVASLSTNIEWQIVFLISLRWLWWRYFLFISNSLTISFLMLLD